jgi:radical SAM protein with 4Fe4S-binding SPASM domain
MDSKRAKDTYRMDGHKLFWHLDRVQAWQEGKPIVPLHVDMGISTGCNFSCRYCYGTLQGRTGTGKRFDMPQQTIEHFFADAKQMGVRSIALIGEGENTLNPALYDVLNFAKNIDLDVSLATNGLLLKSSGLEKALSALTWIRFNISAATENGYRWVHGIGPQGFRQVRKNIEACVKIKQKLGLDTAIGMQMVLLRQGVDEVLPLARLGEQLGVDYLVIKPCSDTYDGRLDAPLDEYQKMESVFLEAESLSKGNYNVIIKRLKMENRGVKEYPVCYGTRFIIAVSGNGNVLPCGHWFNIRTDEFLMGNILHERFRDMINGSRYQSVQERIKTVDVNQECESNCRQHYINRFLWQLSRKPEHINFI